MALPKWQTAVVTRIIDEAPNTRRFFFEVPELDNFVFEPGQFVTLDLPISEVKNKRWRSYSISSSPAGNNTFELLIVLNREGSGTTWMWANVEVGMEMIFRGPLGKFTIPKELDKDLFLICTGTGIAPFRSMVNHIEQHKIPHKHIYLIFGTRRFGDELYAAEMRNLEKTLPNFLYLPTYSREPPNSEYLTGYVHEIYSDILLKKQADADEPDFLPPATIMLCGWQNMIDEARRRLTDMGYTRADLHYELYG